MSTIKTDLLQNRLGTSHPAVTKADFVKAWWRGLYTGGVPATQAGLNISSINDSALGNVALNFASVFASANYSGVSACRLALNYTGSFPYLETATAAVCSLNFHAYPGTAATAAVDPTVGVAQITGDLA
jgi:hypothetical protein